MSWKISTAAFLIAAQLLTPLAAHAGEPSAPSAANLPVDVSQLTLDQADPQAAKQLRTVIDVNGLMKASTDGSAHFVTPGEAAAHTDMIETASSDDLKLKVAGDAIITKDDGKGGDPAKKDKRLHRKLWFVTMELLGVQVGMLTLFAQMPDSWTGWGTGGIKHMVEGWGQGPHFDTDPYKWNYVAHPIAGSEYYLLARDRGVPWWGSLLYSAAMSGFWEFCTEGYFERPSWQDLLITPIAGAVLGELRYEAKKALLDKNGHADKLWKKILVIALDPIDALSGGLK